MVTKRTPGFFTGQMPLLSPNQQCQSTEGMKILQKTMLVRFNGLRCRSVLYKVVL